MRRRDLSPVRYYSPPWSEPTRILGVPLRPPGRPKVPHNHEGKEHRKDCPGCKDEFDCLLKRLDKSRRNRR